MYEREQWLEKINSHAKIFSTMKELTLKSPIFYYEKWRFAAEHQRNFKSLVFKCIQPDQFALGYLNGLIACPSDQKKGWTFRIYSSSDKLDIVLEYLTLFRTNPRLASSQLIQIDTVYRNNLK